MKSTSLFRSLILLSLLEGCAVFWVSISSKSMEKNAWLFGLSPARLAVAAGLLAAIFFFVIVIVRSLKSNTIEGLLNQKFGRLSEQDLLVTLLSGLMLFFIILEMIILTPTSNLFQTSNLVPTAYETLLPGLFWLLLLILQTLVFLTFQKPVQWRSFWIDGRLRNVLFFYIVLQFIAFYWIILLIQSPFFSRIPNWFLRFETHNFSLGLLYLLPFLLLVWGGVRLVFSESIKLRRGILGLIVLGYAAQILFGFVSGEGFEYIRKSYADRPISVTVSYACARTDIPAVIQNYETYHGADFFTKTKPPGFLVGHILFAKFSNLVTGSETDINCKYHYTRLAAFLFPLLSTLAVIPITFLGKHLSKLRHPLLPGLLYILTPNFMLLVLVFDQVFFPLLFILNCVLFYFTITKRSFILSLVSGAVGYLSLFFTFSMLPLFALYLIWIAISFLANRSSWKIFDALSLVAGFLLGFVLLYLIFVLTLNYDAYSRYRLAMSHHREIKDFKFTLSSLANAFVLNTTEYFLWTGIPLLFLAASYGLKSLRAVLNTNGRMKYVFGISFVALYFALNLLSQTHGEVYRLWIFLSPAVVLLAGADLSERLTSQPRRVVIGLLTVQVLTAALQFHILGW